MVKDAEIDSVSGGDCEDETVEKSFFISKNSNKAIVHLISKARLAII